MHASYRPKRPRARNFSSRRGRAVAHPSLLPSAEPRYLSVNCQASVSEMASGRSSEHKPRTSRRTVVAAEGSRRPCSRKSPMFWEVSCARRKRTTGLWRREGGVFNAQTRLSSSLISGDTNRFADNVQSNHVATPRKGAPPQDVIVLDWFLIDTRKKRVIVKVSIMA